MAARTLDILRESDPKIRVHWTLGSLGLVPRAYKSSGLCLAGSSRGGQEKSEGLEDQEGPKVVLMASVPGGHVTVCRKRQ